MKYLSLGLGALALGIVVGACSANSSSTSSSSTTGSAAGSGGMSASASNGSGMGMGGGVGLGCNPACTAPQFCSSAGVCIDPGTCAADADCPSGTVCDTATGMCVPGGMCGAQEATAEAVPPNLLIVLDRSCSMTEAVAGSTKWALAVAAIEKMTTDYNGKIRFGLTMFPDLVMPNCQQAAIPIPPGPGNEMMIQTMLTASLAPADPYFPDGPCVTNIDTAMQQAAAEPAFNDTTRASYALLLTDGKQSIGCIAGGGDNGTTQAITDLYQTKKVATFVLGFGTGIDPAQMNIFADAGGVPTGDPVTHYYLAEDQMSLDAALGAIASKTLGCTFTLNSVPPDPTKIFVFFDNNVTPIPQDPAHMNGWDYDPTNNQVTFYGAACDSLKAGAIHDVDIVFGCNQPTPD